MIRRKKIKAIPNVLGGPKKINAINTKVKEIDVKIADEDQISEEIISEIPEVKEESVNESLQQNSIVEKNSYEFSPPKAVEDTIHCKLDELSNKDDGKSLATVEIDKGLSRTTKLVVNEPTLEKCIDVPDNLSKSDNLEESIGLSLTKIKYLEDDQCENKLIIENKNENLILTSLGKNVTDSTKNIPSNAVINRRKKIKMMPVIGVKRGKSDQKEQNGTLSNHLKNSSTINGVNATVRSENNLVDPLNSEVNKLECKVPVNNEEDSCLDACDNSKVGQFVLSSKSLDESSVKNLFSRDKIDLDPLLIQNQEKHIRILPNSSSNNEKYVPNNESCSTKVTKTSIHDNKKTEKPDKDSKAVEKTPPKSGRVKKQSKEITSNLINSKYINLSQKSRVFSEENKRKFFERKQRYRKKISDGIIKKNNLTMFDLIFWNPCSNPMPDGQNSSQKQLTSQSDTESVSVTDALEEERVENEGLEILQETPGNSDKEITSADVTKEENLDDNLLAPQVKIGPNGELIIDEKSLMIRTTAAKNRDKVLSKSEIIEEVNDSSHYGKWSKRRKRSAEWTKRETKRFYKALSTVGTDFSLMHTIFTHRSREELKMKFKKEERINRNLIDKALNDCTQFDFSIFDESDYDPEEDRKEAKEAEKEAARKKREREKLAKKLEREKLKKEKKELKLINRKRKKLLKSTFKPKGRPRTRRNNVKQTSPSSPQLVIEPQEVICEVFLSGSEETTRRSSRKKTKASSVDPPHKATAENGMQILEVVELNATNCSFTVENNPDFARDLLEKNSISNHDKNTSSNAKEETTLTVESLCDNINTSINHISSEEDFPALMSSLNEPNGNTSAIYENKNEPIDMAKEKENSKNEPMDFIKEKDNSTIEMAIHKIENEPLAVVKLKENSLIEHIDVIKEKQNSNMGMSEQELEIPFIVNEKSWNRNDLHTLSSVAGPEKSVVPSQESSLGMGSVITMASRNTSKSTNSLASLDVSHAASSMKSISVQTFVPVAEVEHAADGSSFVNITTSTGVARVPVPTLNSDTSGIVVMATPAPEIEGGNVFHVYLIAPLNKSARVVNNSSSGSTTNVDSLQ